MSAMRRDLEKKKNVIWTQKLTVSEVLLKKRKKKC